MHQQHAGEHERRHRDERTSEKGAHGVFPFLSSVRSKKPTTRRSYSAGSVVMPVSDYTDKPTSEARKRPIGAA
jgi:hypothetical protein